MPACVQPSAALDRRSAHPLEVLPRLQPRPRAGEPGLVGAAQGHHAARHRRLHPSRPGSTTCGRTCVPAEPGLFRLAPGARGRRSPGGCRRALHAPVRFMLSVEISTIYKRDDRTRKVHHLIYLPDLDAVARFNAGSATVRAGSAATSARTAGRSSAWTRGTCWRSRWRRARTASWCRRTSGRRGSPRWAPSPASTRSPTATPTWPSTSTRSRPG